VAFVDYFSDPKAEVQRFADMWELAANRVKGMVRIAATDATKGYGADLAKQAQLSEFPQILLFPSLAFADPKHYGALPYRGPHKVESIANWALSQLPDGLVHVIRSKATLNDLREDTTHFPKVVYLSQKDHTPPLYKALTLEFFNRVVFFELRAAKYPQLSAEFNITTFPSLLVYADNETDPIQYDGASFGWDSVTSFIQRYVLTEE
jgi:hypothetical protein